MHIDHLHLHRGEAAMPPGPRALPGLPGSRPPGAPVLPGTVPLLSPVPAGAGAVSLGGLYV
jgi:hypothetical protein